MFGKLWIPATYLVALLGSATVALSQCQNQITLVPLRPFKAASKARDFNRFKFALDASNTLLIRSHEDTETSIGPYDTGFSITRNGTTLQQISLRKLPELSREDADYQNSFITLAVTRACGNDGPIYFVSMQYTGGMTSPTLTFTVIPSAQGYKISTLPMLSGGMVEVSSADPHHLRTWDNLHEGDCEACETRYEITDYEIQNGQPMRIKKYRTKHLYTSGNFDNRRRIRFMR